MTFPLVVKVCILEDIHRVTFKEQPTFEELKKRIETSCNINITGIKWTDDSGDKIAMFNQHDFDELLIFIKESKSNSIKLDVTGETDNHKTSTTPLPPSKNTDDADMPPPPSYPTTSNDDDISFDIDDDSDEDDDDDDDSDNCEDYDPEKVAAAVGTSKSEEMIEFTTNDSFMNLYNLLKSGQISPKVYSKLLRKANKCRRRRGKMTKSLERIKSHRSFNAQEFNNKLEILRKVSPFLENEIEMHLILAFHIIKPKNLEKPIKYNKKMTDLVFNDLKTLSESGLPFGPRVAKILSRKYNSKKIVASPQVLQLSKQLEGLGIPEFVLCKILAKNKVVNTV